MNVNNNIDNNLTAISDAHGQQVEK